MPLIIISGIPCSGKTKISNLLASYIIENTSFKSIQILNEEFLNIDRKIAYSDSIAERKARGNLKSAVEKYLTKDCVVICDSLNYIKGFRYELFCRARALLTPSCVVYCDADLATSEAHNNDVYEPNVLKDLVSRMEVPSTSKWDKPLFKLNAFGDNPTELFKDIAANLKSGSSAPTLATAPARLLDTNYLFTLDQLLQTTEKAVLAASSENRPFIYKVAADETDEKSDKKEKDIIQHFDRKLNLPEIRRIRQLFVSVCKMKPPIGSETEIVRLFMKFIVDNLNMS